MQLIKNKTKIKIINTSSCCVMFHSQLN
uniref:Uncharacterized protein n=1 Tax=Anguilla anguilla TaxID=7936 RepID=A0A0E9UU86_ANGAN